MKNEVKRGSAPLNKNCALVTFQRSEILYWINYLIYLFFRKRNIAMVLTSLETYFYRLAI